MLGIRTRPWPSPAPDFANAPQLLALPFVKHGAITNLNILKIMRHRKGWVHIPTPYKWDKSYTYKRPIQI